MPGICYRNCDQDWSALHISFCLLYCRTFSNNSVAKLKSETDAKCLMVPMKRNKSSIFLRVGGAAAGKLFTFLLPAKVFTKVHKLLFAKNPIEKRQ